jgi:4-diphosphocytidyl-2-C-methyl-D-erythritol kinase
MDVTVFSPAKLNLFLAVTGRRADNFHDLVSVAAPLDFGDRLFAQAEDWEVEGELFTLKCDCPGVPVDASNLVLRAAQAFAAATGWDRSVRFTLKKNTPLGAGLGGGSSNAVATLRALNHLSGNQLDEARLTQLAAGLGSDCALFIRNAPVVMRGRGERVEPLPAGAAARVRGRRVLLFRPSFGINTPWAYGRMVARGTDYLPAADAEARLANWLAGSAPVEELLFNNMQPVAFEKYLALPVLLERLRGEFGVTAGMSGSGSACFALLRDDVATAPLVAAIRAAWGPGAFVQEARLA